MTNGKNIDPTTANAKTSQTGRQMTSPAEMAASARYAAHDRYGVTALSTCRCPPPQ